MEKRSTTSRHLSVTPSLLLIFTPSSALTLLCWSRWLLLCLRFKDVPVETTLLWLWIKKPPHLLIRTKIEVNDFLFLIFDFLRGIQIESMHFPFFVIQSGNRNQLFKDNWNGAKCLIRNKRSEYLRGNEDWGVDWLWQMSL